jgi:hypothetical protein
MQKDLSKKTNNNVSEQPREITKEIVVALEKGVDKHLSKSLKYSPFRLFFNMFRKSNPNLMTQVREYVRQDIEHLFMTIKGYNPVIFIHNNNITPEGKQMLKTSYNLGIYILKKKLTVVTAFKAVTNPKVRDDIYHFILEALIKSATKIIYK